MLLEFFYFQINVLPEQYCIVETMLNNIVGSTMLNNIVGSTMLFTHDNTVVQATTL